MNVLERTIQQVMRTLGVEAPSEDISLRTSLQRAFGQIAEEDVVTEPEYPNYSQPSKLEDPPPLINHDNTIVVDRPAFRGPFGRQYSNQFFPGYKSEQSLPNLESNLLKDITSQWRKEARTRREFADLQDAQAIPGMNVEFEPQSGRATVYLFAALDHPFESVRSPEGEDLMQIHSASLQRAGLSIPESQIVRDSLGVTYRVCEIPVSISTQAELDALMYTVKSAGRVLGKRNTIGLLTSIIDDESYEAINESLEQLGEVTRHECISFNQVFEARDRETGEAVMVMVHGNERRARMEAAANYFLSQQLGGVVTKGYAPEPIQYGDLFITVQQKVEDEQAYDAHYYMAALAQLHSSGAEILLRHKVKIPNHQAKEFEGILENLSKGTSPALYHHLKQQYEELAAEVAEGPRTLIHGDAKSANIDKGKLLDLESLKMGNPAIDLSLYLATSGIHKEKWGRYVQTYMDCVQQETGRNYTPDDLVQMTDTVQRTALVPAVRELGGLYSRPVGSAEERQITYLRRVLQENA